MLGYLHHATPFRISFVLSLLTDLLLDTQGGGIQMATSSALMRTSALMKTLALMGVTGCDLRWVSRLLLITPEQSPLNSYSQQLCIFRLWPLVSVELGACMLLLCVLALLLALVLFLVSLDNVLS